MLMYVRELSSDDQVLWLAEVKLTDQFGVWDVEMRAQGLDCAD